MLGAPDACWESAFLIAEKKHFSIQNIGDTIFLSKIFDVLRMKVAEESRKWYRLQEGTGYVMTQ